MIVSPFVSPSRILSINPVHEMTLPLIEVFWTLQSFRVAIADEE
jgi:hypothetical protein